MTFGRVLKYTAVRLVAVAVFGGFILAVADTMFLGTVVAGVTSREFAFYFIGFFASAIGAATKGAK